MRQEIRLLVKSKQMAKARKLAGRLARLFPRQVDVHVAWGVGKAMGADDPSLSMTWHGASYREVVKQLVAKGGWRVRELPRKPRGARRVVLRCQKARWLDVVRALVWSMGDDLHVDAGRKLVRVVPGVSRMGKTVDLSTKEVPDVLRLVVGVARKTGVSLVLRRPSFSLQEGDIHIFPAFGVVRGSGRARALFRKRLRLLPYGLLVKAFAHKPLSPGWGEDALFLGVMSISARLLFPVLVQPASQPLSRPVSRPAPKPGKRSLSADDVRQVIRARKSGVRLCFERFRTEMDGRKRVRLIVRLVVTSSGRVKKVAFPVKIQGLVRLKGCMKEWGLSLRFARTTGRRTVIHYPFVFQVP
jgi:hypothetical protein